jgi:phosphoribulokinase
MARPIIVAVGGAPGSGKATFTAGLQATFGPQRLAALRLDDYRNLDRAQCAAAGIPEHDPRAFAFASMQDALWELAHGRDVTVRPYDRTSGTFGAETKLEARPVIVVEGLVPLHTRALRSLVDVAIWLESEREHSDEVISELAQAQRLHADLCLTFGAQDDVRIVKGGRFAPLDYTEFASPATHLHRLAGGEGPYPRTEIEIDGDIESPFARRIERNLLAAMALAGHGQWPQGLGLVRDERGTRLSHPLAIAQLLIARRILLVTEQLNEALAA